MILRLNNNGNKYKAIANSKLHFASMTKLILNDKTLNDEFNIVVRVDIFYQLQILLSTSN